MQKKHLHVKPKNNCTYCYSKKEDKIQSQISSQ